MNQEQGPKSPKRTSSPFRNVKSKVAGNLKSQKKRQSIQNQSKSITELWCESVLITHGSKSPKTKSKSPIHKIYSETPEL